jgi:hypothetical protein
VRGMSDYTNWSGAATNYDTLVLEDGNRVFGRETVTSQASTSADGSKTIKFSTVTNLVDWQVCRNQRANAHNRKPRPRREGSNHPNDWRILDREVGRLGARPDRPCGRAFVDRDGGSLSTPPTGSPHCVARHGKAGIL